MSIHVMKFGGTSVANLSRIKNIVNLINEKVQIKSNKVIVVVSAMSGVTNNLVDQYKKIKKETDNPEYDVILSTGEQHSSALISTMLNNSKIFSRSMLGGF